MKLNYNLTKLDQKYQKRIETLLNKLYKSSSTVLDIEGYDPTYAEEFIEDIENFLVLSVRNKYDINRIITSLENIDCISFLPGQNRNLPVFVENKKIRINPDLPSDPNLTSRERRRLYLYQGMLKKILNFRNEDAVKFSMVYDQMLTGIIRRTQIEKMVRDGWLVLEDGLAQKIAEYMAYDSAGKYSKSYTYGGDKSDSKIITDSNIHSNLEAYRMFEPIIILFAMTLGEIGMQSEYDERVINIMMQRKVMKENSFDNSFPKQVIKEYVDNNHVFELYSLLYNMGILLNAKYASMGIKGTTALGNLVEDNDQAYQNIQQIASELITFNTESMSFVNNNIAPAPDNKKIKRKIYQLAGIIGEK